METAQGRMVVVGDEFFDRQANDHDRQGAKGNGQPQSGGGILPIAPAAGLENSPAHLQQIPTEVGQHRNDAAQLDDRRYSHAGISPAEDHRNHLEVG